MKLIVLPISCISSIPTSTKHPGRAHAVVYKKIGVQAPNCVHTRGNTHRVTISIRIHATYRYDSHIDHRVGFDSSIVHDAVFPVGRPARAAGPVKQRQRTRHGLAAAGTQRQPSEPGTLALTGVRGGCPPLRRRAGRAHRQHALAACTHQPQGRSCRALLNATQHSHRSNATRCTFCTSSSLRRARASAASPPTCSHQWWPAWAKAHPRFAPRPSR